MPAINNIDINELLQWQISDKEFVLIDVREDYELVNYENPDAMHLPFSEIMNRLEQIPKHTDLVIACHLGERSALLVSYLSQMQFDSTIYNLKGGFAPLYTDNK